MMDIVAFHPKEQSSVFTRDDLVQSNARSIQATKSMLLHTWQCPIRILLIRFQMVEECIDVVRCVDKAVTNRRVTSLQFLMYPEIIEDACTKDHKINYGRLSMRFLGAGPRAFAGLGYLYIQCLLLSKDEMSGVLKACNSLEHLYLHKCDYGFQSLMKIEHPRLTTLTFSYCIFETAELTWLPRLTHLTCDAWTATKKMKYPISFGYVPQISTLILKNLATIRHKTIQLSEFLSSNVMITELDLDFRSLRVRFGFNGKLQNSYVMCCRICSYFVSEAFMRSAT